MKAPLKTLIALITIVAFNFTFVEAQTKQREKYKLVWEDNFDGTELNKDYWQIVENGKGGGNRELQYYRAENISVGKEPVSAENCLIITAKKENYRFKKATSGRLSTQDKMSFQYGKLEARIKLPETANGLWPAFWMLGSDYPKAVWPKCGEIDILEMGNENGIKNGTTDRYFNGACHWGEKFNHGAYPNFGMASTNAYSLQKDFHLYTLIWDKDNIRMYVDLDKYPDVKPYFEMPIAGEGNLNHPSRYFHKKFFVVFNLAVGGNFPNIRKIKQITALKNGDAKMYVDYIRLYQTETSENSFSHK